MTERMVESCWVVAKIQARLVSFSISFVEDGIEWCTWNLRQIMTTNREPPVSTAIYAQWN